MPGANLGGRAAACSAWVPGGGEQTRPALASTIREPGPGPASVHTPGQDGLSHRTGLPGTGPGQGCSQGLGQGQSSGGMPSAQPVPQGRCPAFQKTPVPSALLICWSRKGRSGAGSGPASDQ